MTQSTPIPESSMRFPHLSHPCITEAVIEFRARASVTLNENEILSHLKTLLPGYSKRESLYGYEGEIQLNAEKGPQLLGQNLGWVGFRLTSDDAKHIARFQKDAFSFSRLAPYTDWNHFIEEATRLWKIFMDLAKPNEVQRLGVRFINRFPITDNLVQVNQYFKVFPNELSELSFKLTGFLHRSTFFIPDQPYALNVIKTIQPPQPPKNETALLLDLDVYTQEPFEPEFNVIERKLVQIRLLKNQAFFGIITQNLLEKLK